MEEKKEIYSEPVSPTGQYMTNSVLSVSIIGVFESEIPIDDSQFMPLINNFLSINPRFSSIMVIDTNGVKRWKKVEVNLKDHLNIPTFSDGMPIEFYDKYLEDYLAKIAMDQLPEFRPLWEIHIIKYPTINAAGNLIFKLHHALGDGFSLMGAILSCLQRADNPSLPLTFPHVRLHTSKEEKSKSNFRKVSKIFSSVYNTISDFCSDMVRSSLVVDPKSPIRSGHFAPQFLPVTVTTMTFSLDHIKQIKAKLGVTINDVITGAVSLGTRLYMEAEKEGSGSIDSTSLVLLNTRMFRGYTSVQEMLKPNSELPWGNHFAFLSVPIPKLTNPAEAKDPLQFVLKARKIIQNKRTSFAVYLTAKYLQLVHKFRGAEAASKYFYYTLNNTSLTITNIMGPLEKIAFANNPIKGMYFVVTGCPQNILMGVVSYMGTLRIAMLVEKDFIDPYKLKSHVENAFDMILKAASESVDPSPAN